MMEEFRRDRVAQPVMVSTGLEHTDVESHASTLTLGPVAVQDALRRGSGDGISKSAERPPRAIHDAATSQVKCAKEIGGGRVQAGPRGDGDVGVGKVLVRPDVKGSRFVAAVPKPKDFPCLGRNPGLSV